MKKVLYTASTFGHLASFHQPYLAWFARQGCEVHAAAGGNPCELEGVSHATVLPFCKSMFSPKNFWAVVMLARLLRQEKYDFISTHTALGAFFTRMAVRLAGKRHTVVMNTVHGYLFDSATRADKRRILLGAEKMTAGVTDYVLTMNEQDLRIAQKYKLAKNIVQTPGMGVDLSRFPIADADQKWAARERFGLPQDGTVLVYVAEFSKRKNQKMLLEALCQLPENVCLLLPGRGDLLEDCHEEAHRLGISGRVKFPGFLTDVTAAYHASDICVSSSRIEGLPFNLMEAMACGLPCVVTSIKGHEDLVHQESTGFLFPYNDQEAFCSAIQRLMDAPEMVRQMGHAASRAVRTYEFHAVFEKLTQIYTAALYSTEN